MHEVQQRNHENKQNKNLRDKYHDWTEEFNSFNSRSDQAEESMNSKISDFQLSQREKEKILGYFMGKHQVDTIVPNTRRIKKENSRRIFKDTMADNIPNLGREIVVRFFETQRIPNRLNPKRATLRHIIVNTQYLQVSNCRVKQQNINNINTFINIIKILIKIF